MDEAKQSTQQYRLRSLHQDKRTRFWLRIGAVITVIISVFGFIFYSVFFGQISIGPVPVEYIPYANASSTVIQAVNQTLISLQRKKLISIVP